MTTRLVKAGELQMGDRLFYTGEIVIRTFRDRMTSDAHINVVLYRDGREVRTTTYQRRRRIKLAAGDSPAPQHAFAFTKS